MKKTLTSLVSLSALSLCSCAHSDNAPVPAAASSPATSSTAATLATATSTPGLASSAPTTTDAAPTDVAASAGPSNSHYTATINGAAVTIPNAAATCSVTGGSTHFNVSNANDPTSPVLDIILGSDQKLLALAYATATNVTLMNDPSKPGDYTVQSDGTNYTVSGTGISGDFTTPVPFEITFTCNA